MKEVPTELFVIVNEEKEIPKLQFSKSPRKWWELLRWCSKGQHGSGEQADFEEKCHVKRGSFLELFIFGIWSIYQCPQGDQDPYTQPVPCYGDATEQPSVSEGGLTKPLQGHTPTASPLFVGDVVPVLSVLVSVD